MSLKVSRNGTSIKYYYASIYAFGPFDDSIEPAIHNARTIITPVYLSKLAALYALSFFVNAKRQSSYRMLVLLSLFTH
jgi:hypothetical protein